MRDIKFRGKFLDDTSEWLYGNYVYIEDDVFHHKIADKSGLLLDIDNNTIGQYTGLKDKNGKEIYEGDIVKVFTNKEWRIGKIIYEHSEFTIDVTNNKDLKYGRTSIIENLTEVIGNIYDNPELLEGGE